jgi:uncharacterized membrane protein
MPIKDFFTKAEQAEIVKAIQQAELKTSGEIRVHLETKCKEDVLDHAAYIFKELSMHKTQLRNGVLFYLSVDDHKFAILGDAGINDKVENNFWDKIKDHAISCFKKEEYVKGLCESILMAGEQLKKHFPHDGSLGNELSDEISFGKNT